MEGELEAPPYVQPCHRPQTQKGRAVSTALLREHKIKITGGRSASLVHAVEEIVVVFGFPEFVEQELHAVLVAHGIEDPA